MQMSHNHWLLRHIPYRPFWRATSPASPDVTGKTDGWCGDRDKGSRSSLSPLIRASAAEGNKGKEKAGVSV